MFSFDSFQAEVDRGELRLMLFPSQIQKISSLIALMAHQRDLLQRLNAAQEFAKESLAEHFMWKAQMQYSYVEDKKSANVTVSRVTVVDMQV